MTLVASGFAEDFLYAEPYSAGLVDGYSQYYDTGTDRLKLGGVENPIEFNGFKINVKNRQDAIKITSIDGLSDADVRDSRDVNPGYDGETAFSAYYGGRTIVLNGFIRAGTLNKLRDMQEGLKSIFAPLDEKPLILKGVTPSRDLQINCRKTQPINMAETQNGFKFEREFQVTLRASDFRFVGRELQLETFSAANTYVESSYIGSIANLGNYSADTIIRIDAPAGGLHSDTNGGHGIYIENRISQSAEVNSNSFNATTNAVITGESLFSTISNFNNDFLKIKAKNSSTTEVLAEEEYFLADTKNRTLYRFDAISESLEIAYSQLETNSEWMKLNPGINPIYAQTFTNSSPLITVYYRHTFI